MHRFYFYFLIGNFFFIKSLVAHTNFVRESRNLGKFRHKAHAVVSLSTCFGCSCHRGTQLHIQFHSCLTGAMRMKHGCWWTHTTAKIIISTKWCGRASSPHWGQYGALPPTRDLWDDSLIERSCSSMYHTWHRVRNFCFGKCFNKLFSFFCCHLNQKILGPAYCTDTPQFMHQTCFILFWFVLSFFFF